MILLIDKIAKTKAKSLQKIIKHDSDRSSFFNRSTKLWLQDNDITTYLTHNKKYQWLLIKFLKKKEQNL